MSKHIIMMIFLIVPFQAYGQLPVIDAANQWINSQELFNQLEEMERSVRQLQAIKSQLEYAKRSYERRIENLKKLKDARWDGLGKINDNIRLIRNTSNGVANTTHYLERRYRYLYNGAERLGLLSQDPEVQEKIEEDTRKHMSSQADSVIISGEENSNSIEDDYERLDKAQDMMNEEGLTPEQMRQIQGMIQVMNAQQMAEIKRMIAQYTTFAARQYKLSQMREAEQDSLSKIQQQDLNQNVKDWKNTLDTSERSMVPEWVKEDN